MRSHKSVANDSGAHFSDCRAAAPSILSHQSLFHGCLTLAGFTFLMLFQGNFSATSKRSYLVGVGSGRGGGGVHDTGGLILPVGTRDWLSGKSFLKSSTCKFPRSNEEELRARRIGDFEHSRSTRHWLVVRLRDRDDASIHCILLLAQGPHDADGVGMRLTETVSEKNSKDVRNSHCDCMSEPLERNRTGYAKKKMVAALSAQAHAKTRGSCYSGGQNLTVALMAMRYEGRRSL